MKLNPNGVVPTLVHDGRVVIDSAIIAEYLDDAFPEPPLRPDDLVHRADMRRFCMLPDTGLHAACATLSFSIAFRHQLMAYSRDEQDAHIEMTPDPARQQRNDWRLNTALTGRQSRARWPSTASCSTACRPRLRHMSGWQASTTAWPTLR